MRGIKMNVDVNTAKTGIAVLASSRFKKHQSDRTQLEQQWLKNLRQYRGVYDPEVLAVLPPGRSRVYPKETHTKVVGFVAKMMEMMFPASDKNWQVKPTAIPSIAEADIKGIITTLEQERSDASAPIDSEAIEAKVKELAEKRAASMELEIEDQLQDLGGDGIDYPQLCKKVLRSGGIYGYGILVGPRVRSKEERSWVKQADGSYRAVTQKVNRPQYDHKRVWDVYPDLSAKSWRKQAAIFERNIMLRSEIRFLMDRADFDKEAIRKYLADNKAGNYTPNTYESQLDSLNKAGNTTRLDTNKFEVIAGLMYLGATELRNAGVKGIPENALGEEMLAEVWFIGDTVIKLDLAPFATNPADAYHVFIFDEDEDAGLTGNGLPEVLRDSQMRLCSIDRATQDNMASCAGPAYEVNKDLLSPGQNVEGIRAFTVIYREGDGVEASSPAVRPITMESHITELITLRQEVLSTFDRESSLPAWLFGSSQNMGEAFRTTNNMSIMTGGANMVTKDIVRSFDIFTASVIGSTVRWNMEFNPKQDIKGDYNVLAKGNLSLVAKEVRGAAMDQLLLTLTPEERAICKTRRTLIEKFKSRDLDVDLVEDEATSKQILDNMQQAQTQASQIEQGLTQSKTQKLSAEAQRTSVSTQILAAQNEAKTAEILARVEKILTDTKSVRDKTQLEHVKTLLGGVKDQLALQQMQSMGGTTNV